MTDKLPKIAPSQTITRMEQALAELHARLKVERKKEHHRAELVSFLQRRPALNRRDVLDALEAVGRGKRQKGDRAVTSAHAHAAIGRAIAKAREAKGMTKAALGEKVGRHNSTVTYWEQGKGLPPKELRGKITKLLGLPKGTLANGHATA
jgi:ribosome-binding protein aMBF1 (putative translation factor)